MRDYFDISDILSEEERVPLVFDTPALDIGYLVEGSHAEDVDMGTKVELPFWLAVSMSVPRYAGSLSRATRTRWCCEAYWKKTDVPAFVNPTTRNEGRHLTTWRFLRNL